MFRKKKKKTFRTNYSSTLSSKVQNLIVFSIIYMIRIRFCGPVESIQNELGTAQYSWTGATELFSKYSHSRGRGTELISNSGYSRGRGTERP